MITGFNGSIPSEICRLTRLQVLDLSRNNFSGKIPDCFNNFSTICGNDTYEPFVGVLYNDLFGSFKSLVPHSSPGQAFEYERLIVQWKGRVAEYTKILGLLKLIDLSNRIVGSIPISFSNLKGLNFLNPPSNSLRGNIIPGIGEMEALEILDLSRNQLSGKLPVGLAHLHYLSVLDLANNNLSGEIPLSTQLQSFNASAYAGNNGLCGPPLPLCNNTSYHSPEDNSNQKGSGFSLSNRQELFISVFLGCFVGFWGVVASLVFKQSWRNAYFKYLDAVGDWFYVNTTLFFNKFRRRLR
ncbi:hypothetical protein ACS0TY_030983 [Phlomoides rotata]